MDSEYVPSNYQKAYNMYGVDLIRTAGLLAHSSPSCVYRASTLFQRFQKSVDQNFRKYYFSEQELREIISRENAVIAGTGETYDELQTFLKNSGKEEYVLPDLGNPFPSGINPLGDLFAPIDYCIASVIKNEDIVYLAAACLLIVSKVEDQHVVIRTIVNIFLKLTARRCDLPVETKKVSDDRYNDFKSCVIAAEGVVLQQLGFQTFVECPIKYASLFLNLLVEEESTEDSHDNPENKCTSEDQISGTLSENKTYSKGFYDWLVRMVRFINDIPRCSGFCDVDARAVAVLAIQETRPSGLVLPTNWHWAFGVPQTLLLDLTTQYNFDISTTSSKQRVDELKITTVFFYRTRMDWAKAQFDLDRAKLRKPKELPKVEPKADVPVVVSVPTPPPVSTPPPPVEPVLPVVAPVPTFNVEEFEEIGDIRRRQKEERKREKKEREEKRKREEEAKPGSSHHRKRDRSSSIEKSDRHHRRDRSDERVGKDRRDDRRDRHHHDRDRDRNRDRDDRQHRHGDDRDKRKEKDRDRDYGRGREADRGSRYESRHRR